MLLDRLGPDSAVVVFEKDPELRAALSEAFTSFLGIRVSDPRLFLLEEDTEACVRVLFSRLPLSRLRRCEFLTLNGAWMAHGPRYRQVFARLDEGLTRWWSNRMTCLHMGPLWIRNFFDNLRSGPSARPWPHWGEAPVLVCGAGVTLEEALPWARTHRKAVRLLAADTALPVLKAWDLVPDAVVCLEAQHANLRDFAGWKGASVQLFTDLTSYPPGTRVFGPPPCWFLTEFAELSLWGRLPWPAGSVPLLPTLGSVGVAAAWVAWRVTRGPVILAGLDFSFPPGKTHARGAPALQSLAARSDRLTPFEQAGVWERPGVRTTARGWLTTPVMEGYAGVLAEQAGPETHRTWVWAQAGLPLGLPLWDQAPPLPVPALAPPPPDPPLTAVAGVLPWLEAERERWRDLLDQFSRINGGGASEEDWDLLETSLREVDYLTFSFPDPEFRRDSDWLSRALMQVRWILQRTS